MILKFRSSRLIRLRLTRLEERLANLLGDPHSPPEEVKEVIESYEQVKGFLKDVRRHSFLRWLISIGATVLGAMAVLSLVHLRNPSVVLTASTRALVFGIGTSDEEIANTLPLTRFFYSGHDGTYSLCSLPLRRPGCMPADSIILQSLSIYAGGAVRLRRIRQCNELTFLSGGGLMQLSIVASDAINSPPQMRGAGASTAPISGVRFVRIKKFETVQYCGVDPQDFILREPRFLLLGDITSEVLGESVPLPAASNGSILFSDTGVLRSFSRTDVVEFNGLNQAMASIHEGEALDVALSAKAKRVQIVRSALREEANPTFLDFVLGSPHIKAVGSLLLSLLACLGILRTKFDEITS